MKTYLAPEGTYWENTRNPSPDWIDCGERPSYFHFWDKAAGAWVEDVAARDAYAAQVAARGW